jgi:hypothetical protein
MGDESSDESSICLFCRDNLTDQANRVQCDTCQSDFHVTCIMKHGLNAMFNGAIMPTRDTMVGKPFTIPCGLPGHALRKSKTATLELISKEPPKPFWYKVNRIQKQRIQWLVLLMVLSTCSMLLSLDREPIIYEALATFIIFLPLAVRAIPSLSAQRAEVKKACFAFILSWMMLAAVQFVMQINLHGYCSHLWTLKYFNTTHPYYWDNFLYPLVLGLRLTILLRCMPYILSWARYFDLPLRLLRFVMYCSGMMVILVTAYEAWAIVPSIPTFYFFNAIAALMLVLQTIGMCILAIYNFSELVVIKYTNNNPDTVYERLMVVNFWSKSADVYIDAEQ